MARDFDEITCQYNGVQDSYCGHVHATEGEAEACKRRSHDPRGLGWGTVEVPVGFYARRWPEKAVR